MQCTIRLNDRYFTASLPTDPGAGFENGAKKDSKEDL